MARKKKGLWRERQSVKDCKGEDDERTSIQNLSGEH